MRNFFNSHWKAILAILLAIVLSMLTVETSSNEPPLAARLQMHTQALASAAPSTDGTLRHLEASLRRHGYVPRLQHGDAAHPGRSIDVALSRLAPGEHPDRIIIVGAHLGHDTGAGPAGAAAVLELARIARTLRPAHGTEIRFVFFVSDGGDHGHAADAHRRPGASPDGGNFMAFVGTRASSSQVRQALAALRSDAMLARHGLAAPAHVMGLTLSGHGGGQDRERTLVITNTGFLRFPYFPAGTAPNQAPKQAPKQAPNQAPNQAQPGQQSEQQQVQQQAQQPGQQPEQRPGQQQAKDRNDYDGMAHVVNGLARTLGALAGAVEM